MSAKLGLALVLAATLWPLPSHAENLSPDEVAMILGTMTVANIKCGLNGNHFPLNVAVAKLGQDLVDFMPDNRYAPLVEVKMKKAHEFISEMGRLSACQAMQDVLFQFLPEIYKKAR